MGFLVVIIVILVVKTPTSTQHHPKSTSTGVGFDMNMTLQPPTHQPPELYPDPRESTVQCKLTNPILDKHLRLS